MCYGMGCKYERRGTPEWAGTCTENIPPEDGVCREIDREIEEWEENDEED